MGNLAPMSFDDVLQRLHHLSGAVPGLHVYRPMAVHLLNVAPAILAPQRGSASTLPWPSSGQLDTMLSPFVFANLQTRSSLYGFSGVRFVAQERKNKADRVSFLGPNGTPREVGATSAAAYVHSIFKRAQVPTRPLSVHDFANALTWAAFPVSKWLLFCALYEDYVDFFANDARQDCSGRGRGLRSDRLTNLDEAGVVAAGPEAREMYFGHALIEHLLTGQESTIYAPFWVLSQGESRLNSSDAAVQSAVLLEAGSVGSLDNGLDLVVARGFQNLFAASSLAPCPAFCSVGLKSDSGFGRSPAVAPGAEFEST
jgi:hypothetical protein